MTPREELAALRRMAELEAKAFGQMPTSTQPSEIPVTRKERGFFETLGAPIQAASEGVISGVGNVMFGGQRLVGMGLEAAGGLFPEQQTLSGLVTGKRPLNAVQQAGSFLQEDAARRLAESQRTVAPFKQEFPIATGTGELAAEVGATFPVGGMIAAPLRAVPAAAPLAQAIRSGGFSTGQAIQKGTPAAARLANIGTRMTGGAITGGGTAAVINPADTETGALIGAAVPLAGTTINYLAKGAGFLKDAFTGQLAAVKAGKISREVAGDRIGAIRAALEAAPEDLTAAQATAGVQNNAFQALGAFAAKTDDISLKLKQAAADDIALLHRMAEGGNETEARRAYEESIKRLNQLTSDMRNVELGAANQAAKTINQLAPQAQQRKNHC